MTNTASQPCSTAQLGITAQQRAVDFILEHGTNLQRERYLCYFATSPVENVLAALSHYQNSDGGFGHGLEADLRTKKSSVIATTVAMQILESLCALDSNLARDAVHYLIGAYDGKNWHSIGPDCNDAAHAPWWRYNAEQFTPATFLANPSSEIISYIISLNVMPSEIPDLMERALAHLVHQDLEMHELMCYTRLYETPLLNDGVKQQMLPHLLSNAYKLVKSEPLDWEEYCLTPLTLINHANSIYTDFFSDVLETNFHFQINRQHEDGSWSPNWSWGGEFPTTWRSVEKEIKAELTLRFLIQLQQFDRLSN